MKQTNKQTSRTYLSIVLSTLLWSKQTVLTGLFGWGVDLDVSGSRFSSLLLLFPPYNCTDLKVTRKEMVKSCAPLTLNNNGKGILYLTKEEFYHGTIPCYDKQAGQAVQMFSKSTSRNLMAGKNPTGFDKGRQLQVASSLLSNTRVLSLCLLSEKKLFWPLFYYCIFL